MATPPADDPVLVLSEHLHDVSAGEVRRDHVPPSLEEIGTLVILWAEAVGMSVIMMPNRSTQPKSDLRDFIFTSSSFKSEKHLRYRPL